VRPLPRGVGGVEPGEARPRPVREGRCGACHEPHGGRAGLLVKEGSLVCGRCHAPAEGTSRGHSRADCAACHVPHASDGPGLLAGPPERRCAACHARSIERPREKRHGPFAQGECLACHSVHAAEACLFCHDPHGSGRRAHPRQEPALLCLSCHTALRSRIARSGAVLHAPVRAAACGECHRPHRSASCSTPTPASRPGRAAAPAVTTPTSCGTDRLRRRRPVHTSARPWGECPTSPCKRSCTPLPGWANRFGSAN
jgi:predicted CXXCH cytochrome family protein